MTRRTFDRSFLHEHLAQPDAYQDILNKRITICGCGAIGSNLAVGLARRGFQRFILIDFDRVEKHNISTQAWLHRDVGKFKAKALAQKLPEINRTVWAIPKETEITSQEQLRKILGTMEGTDVIVDCFDRRKARACTVGISQTVPVLHVGLSIHGTAEVHWDEGYTLPPDVELGDPCNYPMSRGLIEVTVAMAAQAIIKALMTGEQDNERILFP